MSFVITLQRYAKLINYCVMMALNLTKLDKIRVLFSRSYVAYSSAVSPPQPLVQQVAQLLRFHGHACSRNSFLSIYQLAKARSSSRSYFRSTIKTKKWLFCFVLFSLIRNFAGNYEKTKQSKRRTRVPRLCDDHDSHAVVLHRLGGVPAAQ